MSSPAKRAHTPPPPLSQILPQPDVEMATVPMPVPEDAMEVDALCEESVDPSDMAKRFSVQPVSSMITPLREILDRDATIAGIRAEPTQMQLFGVFAWKRTSPRNHPVRKSSARRCSTKPMDTKFGQELWHESTLMQCLHLSTTPALHPHRALKLVISRMMSKGRTRQPASHDVSVAFFHAWLERGVWVKPPKNLRLSDHWFWYVVKALCGMRES